jgi:hypothetical protein
MAVLLTTPVLVIVTGGDGSPIGIVGKLVTGFALGSTFQCCIRGTGVVGDHLTP